MTSDKGQVEPAGAGSRMAEWRRYLAAGGEEHLGKALPEHVTIKKFLRVFETALQLPGKLLECDVRMLAAEATKCAQLGLLVDPHLGEAYLVTEWSPNGPVPKLRVGYRGLLKLARQSGEVSSITAQVVRRADVFRVRLGTAMMIDHEPEILGPPGDVLCYYACVCYKDASIDFEVMTLEQVRRIRDRSDAWKAFAAGKIKSTPWSTDEDEMARKTVLRRLLKRVPMSADTQTRLEEVEAAPAPALPAPAAAPMLEHDAASASRLDALALAVAKAEPEVAS